MELSSLKKYFSELLTAITVISIFQSKVEIGNSLSIIVENYSALRDVFFIPFKWININIVDFGKNLIAFFLALTFSFVFRGDTNNKNAVVALSGSLILFIVGGVLVAISVLISGQEVWEIVDNEGVSGLSFFQLIKYLTSFVFGALGGILIVGFPLWVITIIAPFSIAILSNIPVVKYGIFYSFFMSTSLSFWVAKKIFPKMQTLSNNWEEREEVIFEFASIWTLKEYVKYYKPLLDILFVVIVIVTVFKIIIDNI